MEELSAKGLSIYNQFWMELEELYSAYAKGCGLSNCPFWIFYLLHEDKKIYTQKDLSEKLSLSRQTVNSALKSLREEGLIELVPLPGQRKNKQVVLTPAGSELVQKIIVPIREVEQRAFKNLNEEEQERLLDLTRKYIEFFRKEIK